MTSRITAATTVVLFALAARAGAEHRTLVVDGQSLVMKKGSERVVVRMLPDEAEFQGFGFIGDHAVFLAYSGDSEGGASTVLAIYDLDRRIEYPICELGATGESSFAVSEDGSKLAFNWYRGIYAGSLDGLLDAVREGPIGTARCEQRFRQVVACESCYEPKWIGPSRLQYEQQDGKCRKVRTIDL